MKGKRDMSDLVFNQRTPHLLVVDGFYRDPDEIVRTAKSMEFKEDTRYFKGVRSGNCLLPFVKEEFERLLRVQITDWLGQPMNGVFQMTRENHPIVWHSDSQSYAAAVYLTKDAGVGYGTSFWRDRTHGCRRPPNHPLEGKTGVTDAEVYTPYNLLHADNWELVDRVGSVYNRLVIWDAKMIHSATQYGDFERLVQLFFFTVKR